VQEAGIAGSTVMETWCDTSGHTKVKRNPPQASGGDLSRALDKTPACDVGVAYYQKTYTAAELTKPSTANDIVLVDFWASWCGQVARSHRRLRRQLRSTRRRARKSNGGRTRVAAAAQIRSIPQLMGQEGQVAVQQAAPPRKLED